MLTDSTGPEFVKSLTEGFLLGHLMLLKSDVSWNSSLLKTCLGLEASSPKWLTLTANNQCWLVVSGPISPLSEYVWLVAQWLPSLRESSPKGDSGSCNEFYGQISEIIPHHLYCILWVTKEQTQFNMEEDYTRREQGGRNHWGSFYRLDATNQKIFL